MYNKMISRARLRKDFTKLIAENIPINYGEKFNLVDAFFTYRILLNRNPEIIHELIKLAEHHHTYRSLVNSIIESEEFSTQTGFLPSGRKWMAETEGFRLWFDTGDREMGVRMGLGNYEPQSVRLIREHVHPGSTCIDAGANIGFFTCLMASIVGTNGKVYSFEPMPESFEMIERNIRENDFESRVKPFNVACSEERKILPGSITSRMYVLGEVGDCPGVDIQCERIDALIDDKIDFMKIDVEGHEPQALKGMTKIFEQSRPVILSEISEYWLSNFSGMDSNSYLSLLIDLGYDVFPVSNQSLPLQKNSIKHGKLDNLEVIAIPNRA